MRIVLEEYLREDPKRKGIYTLFQTDKEIVNLDTIPAYENDEEERGSRVKTQQKQQMQIQLSEMKN